MASSFQNHTNKVPVPFVIYSDFESIIKSTEIRIPLTNVVATFLDGDLVFNRRYN